MNQADRDRQDKAVNEFLLAVEAIPGHGPATPKEYHLAIELYYKAFQAGQARSGGVQVGNGNVQVNSF